MYNFTNSSLDTQSVVKFYQIFANGYKFGQVLTVPILGIIVFLLYVPKEKRSPGNYLVAHFSFIMAAWVLMDFLRWSQRYTFFGYKIPGICNVLTFSSNAAYAAYPLAVVSLIYERKQILLGLGGRFLWQRAIAFTWTVAGLESVPTLFSSEYVTDANPDIGGCKKIPIFGSVFASTVVYLMRFLFIHIFVVGFLLHDLCNIRSKIIWFERFPIINSEMRGKARKLNFLYWYCLIFIINWIAVGYSIIAYSLLARTQNNRNMTSYFMAGFILEGLYIIVNPLLFLWFNDDILRRRLCQSLRLKNEQTFSQQCTNNLSDQFV